MQACLFVREGTLGWLFEIVTSSHMCVRQNNDKKFSIRIAHISSQALPSLSLLP